MFLLKALTVNPLIVCYNSFSNSLMAALGCRVAERLLWEYIAALGDSDTAHRAYVDAIRTGPASAISVMEKRMKAAMAEVQQASRAFQEHSREHGCCPEQPIVPSPSPPSSRVTPSRRKRRRR